VSDLQDLTVVVTRPQHQADSLCQQLEALGARVIRFPVIGIEQPENPAKLIDLLKRISSFDIAVFISANAVDQAMKWLHEQGQSLATLKIAAVGRATAKALKRHGEQVDIVPQGKFNSEALLQHPGLQNMSNSRIVIFRGDGGREYLAEILIQRGASVEYAECYRRVKPNIDTGPLLKTWARNEIDVVTVTSNQALDNLYELVGKAGQHWLQKTPIIGVSERLRELATRLGMRGDISIAQNASDEAIINTLRDWSQRHK
jgi:uroporphyrinogen-III synthase